MSPKYYAVAVGRQTGIFTSWSFVRTLVSGYSGAIHKSFKTHDDALKYLQQYQKNLTLENQILPQQSIPIPQPIPQQIISQPSSLQHSPPQHPSSQLLSPQHEPPDVEKGRVYYTDGSFIDEYGGYGIVVVDDGVTTRQHNGPVPEYPTTNNRAELYAILMVLSTYLGDLLIRTDSEYSINSLTRDLDGWVKNNWRRSNNQPVKNVDLLQSIVRLSQGRKISFQHVYGHAGEEFNELADRLAKEGRENYGK